MEFEAVRESFCGLILAYTRDIGLMIKQQERVESFILMDNTTKAIFLKEKWMEKVYMPKLMVQYMKEIGIMTSNMEREPSVGWMAHPILESMRMA